MEQLTICSASAWDQQKYIVDLINLLLYREVQSILLVNYACDSERYCTYTGRVITEYEKG
jgi:hypothetical protein